MDNLGLCIALGMLQHCLRTLGCELSADETLECVVLMAHTVEKEKRQAPRHLNHHHTPRPLPAPATALG